MAEHLITRKGASCAPQLNGEDGKAGPDLTVEASKFVLADRSE